MIAYVLGSSELVLLILPVTLYSLLPTVKLLRPLNTTIPNLLYPADAILSPTPISRPAYLLTSRYCLDAEGYTTEVVSNEPRSDSVSTVNLPPVLSSIDASVFKNPVGVAVAPLYIP